MRIRGDKSLSAIAHRYGNDGPWNPFIIGIGTPAQYVKVLISTTATTPNAVAPQACNSSLPATCPDHRGGIFNQNQSSTWKNDAIYSLSVELELGSTATGQFGFDGIQLGLPGSQGGSISLPQQLMAGIVSNNYFIANWGLRPHETNLTSMNNRFPSVIQNLKTQNKIPSLSWGYTAGAYYRAQGSKGAFASLTFGGSDSNRYVPHNTTFNFDPDVSRDLVVGIQSIATNTTSSDLLDEPIQAFLNSGVPHLWLPQSACDAFESAFNLTYNSTLGLYLVNDTVHETLLEQNPNITFTLSNDIANKTPTVNISLPYAAFDLTLTTDYPGVATNNTRYFPLKRAENSSQYTIGRTFFQEAYIIADYERSQFSVHQALFPDNSKQSLQVVAPLVQATPAPANQASMNLPHLSTGATIAVSVVCTVITIAFLTFVYKTRRRWLGQIRKWRGLDGDASIGHSRTPELHQDGFAPLCEACGDEKKLAELLGDTESAELDVGSGKAELHGTDPSKELEAGLVYELPGSEVSRFSKETFDLGLGLEKSLEMSARELTEQDIADCARRNSQPGPNRVELEETYKYTIPGRHNRFSDDSTENTAKHEIAINSDRRPTFVSAMSDPDYEVPEGTVSRSGSERSEHYVSPLSQSSSKVRYNTFTGTPLNTTTPRKPSSIPEEHAFVDIISPL